MTRLGRWERARTTFYPESEYSWQRADAALKLGGREERGKERIL